MKHFDDYTESIDALGAKQQKIVADEIGKTYKFLTVISFAFRNRHELYFNCRCECGTEKLGSTPKVVERFKKKRYNGKEGA